MNLWSGPHKFLHSRYLQFSFVPSLQIVYLSPESQLHTIHVPGRSMAHSPFDDVLFLITIDRSGLSSRRDVDNRGRERARSGRRVNLATCAAIPRDRWSTGARYIVGFGSAYSRTIRFDCADNGGALISVHNCLPALNGAGSIFNWMPAKCQLHRRGSQIEPAPLNNGLRDTMVEVGAGCRVTGDTPLSYTMFRVVPLLYTHPKPLR